MARDGYWDFGKGGGHPAKLNFGDCFAYALAKEPGEPSLFKGGDSAHTDSLLFSKKIASQCEAIFRFCVRLYGF
jgi:uncharacterized protein with PIN domain